MSIVSEVKCPRCDRRYSGIRGRCPYCGARRMGRGKHANGGENTKGKIIIGLLLMGVLVVAVVVLLVSSLGGDPVDPAESETPTGVSPSGEDIETMPGQYVPPPTDPITPSPSESEPPRPVVQSVMITYSNLEKIDISLKVGESVPLKAKVTPENHEETVVWESSDEAVFVVTQEGKVSWTGGGTATLTVTVGDKTAECIIRCDRP